MIGFVFDTILYKKNSDYYGMTLTYEFFKNRYLDKAKKMTIITRTKNISQAIGNIDGYKITNGENVYVNPIDCYNQIPDALIKMKKIKKELKKQLDKCDKVIIRMPSVLGVFACEICRQNNIPYMIEMVACAWDGYCNHTNKMGKIIAPFMYLLTKKCTLKCNCVLYVTSEFLQKRYPTHGKQIACSDVVLCDSDDKVLKKRINRINAFNGKSFSICTVANVGMKYKGHIYVLKAIRKLKKDGVNIKYYLAGNGKQEYLKKYIVKYKLESNVEFLGALPHEKIFEILDNVDIYIQPSLQEGLPRALIEAMSRALPCIGTNVGGIPELLQSNMIFKKKKVSQLYGMLKSFTKNQLLDCAKHNFKYSEKFSKNSLDTKRNKFYSEFLGME